jgi:cyclase
VHNTLIIAKMNAADAESVANIFAESDASDLPEMIGVRHRTLFTFHDLYIHLVQADKDPSPALYRARSHPLYARINSQLSQFISPYDPNWKEPKDAMATPFYQWSIDPVSA